jgi:hypothetical protein
VWHHTMLPWSLVPDDDELDEEQGEQKSAEDTHVSPRLCATPLARTTPTQRARKMASHSPVDVLMVGTGEYTTGFVNGKASDSDKGAGVVVREYDGTTEPWS